MRTFLPQSYRFIFDILLPPIFLLPSVLLLPRLKGKSFAKYARYTAAKLSLLM